MKCQECLFVQNITNLNPKSKNTFKKILREFKKGFHEPDVLLTFTLRTNLTVMTAEKTRGDL